MTDQQNQRLNASLAALAGPGSSRGPSHLLRLPDELLAKIISDAAAEQPEDIDPNGTNKVEPRRPHPAQWAMPLVSRRFYRLATPELYSRIVVDSKAVRKLHRTLESDPSLRSFCKELTFDMRNRENWNQLGLLEHAKALPTWLTNTKTLRLRSNFSVSQLSSAFALLSPASKHMSRLETLDLSSNGARYEHFRVESVFRKEWHGAILRFPALRELRLCLYGFQEAGNDLSLHVILSTSFRVQTEGGSGKMGIEQRA